MRLGSVAALLLSAVGAQSASADTLNLGTAGQYTLLGINGGTVTINDSGTSNLIGGNVGVGPGESLLFQKATITGDLRIDQNAGSVSITAKDALVVGSVQQGLNLSAAAADANSASAYYAGLSVPAGHNLGVLGDNDSRSLVGNGGTNVYSITSLDYKSDSLTLTGTANDVFVFNVADTFMWSQSTITLNGVSAGHVLFNFLGGDSVSGYSVIINKGTTDFSGILLGTNRSIRYHNDASFTGDIIARNILIDSGADITGVSVPVGASGVPLPSTACAGAGLLSALALTARRRSKR